MQSQGGCVERVVGHQGHSSGNQLLAGRRQPLIRHQQLKDVALQWRKKRRGFYFFYSNALSPCPDAFQKRQETDTKSGKKKHFTSVLQTQVCVTQLINVNDIYQKKTNRILLYTGALKYGRSVKSASCAYLTLFYSKFSLLILASRSWDVKVFLNFSFLVWG